LRHHADDLAFRLQRRLRQFPHQPTFPPP
jgi:hypothetical protein